MRLLGHPVETKMARDRAQGNERLSPKDTHYLARKIGYIQVDVMFVFSSRDCIK